MRHPLAEFGLNEDADERAVKRAYAQRLKVTRPDDDAGAFQALNEAYQEALGFIRWRDAQAEEDEPDLSDEAEPPLPADVAADTPSEPETAAGSQWLEENAGRPPQPFTFSLDDFMEGMGAEGRNHDPVRLQQWLRAEMADWPLTARPQIAHAIISHVIGDRVAIPPKVFDTLVDELGLNDVSAGSVDPMLIAQYRDKMEYRFTVANDVVPERSWHKWVTLGLFGIFVFLIFGGLILGDRNMGQSGRSPMASERPWYRSVSFNPDQPTALQSLSDADERTLSLVSATAKHKDAKFIIDMLQKAAGSAPMDLAKRRVLATALYGFGQELQQADKSRAYEAYQELQTRFQAEKDHDIALLVVGSHINIGYGELKTDNPDAALAAFRAVQSQYGYIVEGRIGLQVFNAMFGEARVLHSQQKAKAASAKLDEIIALFALSTDMVLRQAVEKPVREFQKTLSLQPNPT